jgi:hypothetical protein
MNKEEILLENADLKTTVRILSEQIAMQQQEILKLKNELTRAALPKSRIAPEVIELTDDNIGNLLSASRAALRSRPAGGNSRPWPGKWSRCITMPALCPIQNC